MIILHRAAGGRCRRFRGTRTGRRAWSVIGLIPGVHVEFGQTSSTWCIRVSSSHCSTLYPRYHSYLGNDCSIPVTIVVYWISLSFLTQDCPTILIGPQEYISSISTPGLYCSRDSTSFLPPTASLLLTVHNKAVHWQTGTRKSRFICTAEWIKKWSGVGPILGGHQDPHV